MPIYIPKWFELMITLYNMPAEERYCQRLYRRLSMNSSHLRAILRRLEGLRLISRSPTGKIRYITLTERGEALAELAMRMKSTLKEVSADG